MTEKLLTRSYREDSASIFINSVTSGLTYLFAAKHTPYAGSDAVIEVPLDDEEYNTELFRNMIFGKQITASNAARVITNYGWQSGTVYTSYDGSDKLLFTKKFYTIVNAGSNYHVYKCLYNNHGVASTVQPDFSSVSVNDASFQTSDGYIWKYMYSVSSSIVQKFSTTDFFPIVPNTSVSSVAVDGAIDVVQVTQSGNGYANYLSGQNHFGPSQLRINGSGTLYDISSNSSASSANSFYNGCYIYIKYGLAGEVGQYQKIVNYVVNSTSKTIFLENAFANAISISSVYEIYPGVVFNSNGLQTSNAVARAIVNASSNTIDRIDMLSTGKGYQIASAYVYSHPSVGSGNATLQVIKSPGGGHGYDQFKELGSTAAMLNINFSGNESNTIVDSNEYRTVGILRNPTWSNVVITTATSTGFFVPGEQVLRIRPALAGSNATIVSTSNVVTAANGVLSSQFSAGDKVFITSDFVVPVTNQQTFFISSNTNFLATVGTVSNSSSMTLTANSPASIASGASYFIPNISGQGYIIASNSTSLTLSSVNTAINTSDVLIGATSGAIALANTVFIGGVAKGFTTFVNMYKYAGTVISGTFQPDETIYQDDLTTSNAILHSVSSNTFYMTDVFGVFDFGKNIRGLTSGAVGSITKKYDPELTFRSGSVQYIENMFPITRLPGQIETYKLLFEF